MSTTTELKKRERSTSTIQEESPTNKRIRKPKNFDDFETETPKKEPTPEKQKKKKTNSKKKEKTKKISKSTTEENQQIVPQEIPQTTETSEVNHTLMKEETPLKESIQQVQENEGTQKVIKEETLPEENEPEQQQVTEVTEKVKKDKKKKKKVGRPKKKQEEYSPPGTKPQTRNKKEKEKEKRPQRQRKPTQKFEDEGNTHLSKLPEGIQECYKLLLQLKAHKLAWPFLEPVDAIALNLPDYYQIIKNPMDLGTVTDNLLKGRYWDIDSFANDVNLIWTNCYLYNPKDSDVVKMAESCEKLFESKFSKISQSYPQETPEEVEKLVPKIETTKDQTLLNTPIIQTFEVKKRAPKKVTKAPQMDSRKMSIEELKALSANISLLDGEKLATIVQIIQNRAPKASSQANDQEIEVDLDKLDPVTLRQIEKQVNQFLGKRKRAPQQKRQPKKRVTQDKSTIQQTQPIHQPIQQQQQQQQQEIRKKDSGSSSSETESSDSDSDSDTPTSKNENGPKALTQGK